MSFVSQSGRLAVFVRHFQEDEVGQLLQVVAITDAIISQRVAKTLYFGNDTGCVVVHCCLVSCKTLYESTLCKHATKNLIINNV